MNDSTDDNTVSLESSETFSRNNDDNLSVSEDESELFEFYCPTCLISFPNDPTYREHYKTELHLYNMKRKIV